MEKEEVLIFGAGSAGESFLKKNKEYEVLAVLDNDELKVGKYIQGKQIISLNDLSNYSFKKIIITSAYFPEITRQLLNDYNIPKEKIKMAPKSLTGNNKSYRPFECKATFEFAEEILVVICNILEENKISYFVDHGTLLGLVRDGSIIPWDDDIDISVHVNDIEKIYNIMNKALKKLPENDYLKWEIIKYIDDKSNKLSKILIVFDENFKYKSFPISIESFIIKDDQAVQELSYSDKKHFLDSDFIKFKNTFLRIPRFYNEYLEFHYGNWKVKKKDTTFLDAKNYKVPNKLNMIKGD